MPQRTRSKDGDFDRMEDQLDAREDDYVSAAFSEFVFSGGFLTDGIAATGSPRTTGPFNPDTRLVLRVLAGYDSPTAVGAVPAAR